ncbi:hypothetical protein EON64_14720 [archaeon]|nr:MAG: hypothetical protein EON64_14720 [archaeon]
MSPSTCLQAFDQHLNLVLGDVEETVSSREVDEETEEEIVKVSFVGQKLYSTFILSFMNSLTLTF